MILTVSSNGMWHCSLINGMTTGDVIITYLNAIEKWLIDNNNWGYTKIIMILDNCGPHREAVLRTTFKNRPFQVIYLVPYSPQFAPVERCFGLLKIKAIS